MGGGPHQQSRGSPIPHPSPLQGHNDPPGFGAQRDDQGFGAPGNMYMHKKNKAMAGGKKQAKKPLSKSPPKILVTPQGRGTHRGGPEVPRIFPPKDPSPPQDQLEGMEPDPFLLSRRMDEYGRYSFYSVGRWVPIWVPLHPAPHLRAEAERWETHWGEVRHFWAQKGRLYPGMVKSWGLHGFSVHLDIWEDFSHERRKLQWSFWEPYWNGVMCQCPICGK